MSIKSAAYVKYMAADAALAAAYCVYVDANLAYEAASAAYKAALEDSNHATDVYITEDNDKEDA